MIPFFGVGGYLFEPLGLQYYASYYGPIIMTHVGFGHIVLINNYKIYSANFGKSEFLDRNFGDTEFEPGLFLMRYNKQWVKRRQLMMNCIVSQLNSKLLSNVFENIVNQYVFNIIDNCCRNKTRWDIRSESHYMLFASIYSYVGLVYKFVHFCILLLLIFRMYMYT